MSRQIITSVALGCVLFLLAGCINHKVKNPMAGIDSKQPDKGLYDRAMDAMRHGRYQEARTLLETLINTYPDSEYMARAKLSVADAWYAEGGNTAWQEAEVQYKDFAVFYPNMPEAAEAQLKVATIHYRQMEKPDRDFTQAQRAADEYKNLIQQYPDSPLVPEAKQRLREVQEILADRQYRIASFYYLRDNMAAAQARLQSLIDAYPLYSGIDNALYELGSLYEREAHAMSRQDKVPPAVKEKLVAQFQHHAIDAYTRIITRYPAMDRAGDARRRLQVLKAPVPTATAESLAESKAEEQSRESISLIQKTLGNFNKHPNVNVRRSAKVGEPSLEDEKPYSAPAMVQDVQNQILGAIPSQQATQKLGLETVGGGSGAAPGANQPPGSSTGTQPAPGTGTASTSDGAPPTQAPAQVNEVQKTSSADQQTGTQASNNPQNSTTDSKQDSTSKKKNKKGLRKLIPF